MEKKNFRNNPVGNVSPSVFWLLLIVSGAIGFWMGMRMATWQAAIEPAQIMAGLVEYPRNNPFYMHQSRIWTALHQVGAICLLCGISERTLSLILSGVLGMVIFQAMSMSVLVFSRHILISLLAPFFIVYTSATDFGVTYPVLLMGYNHTYGILALSYAVLVLAIFGTDRIELGALLLGFAPAVHPPTGAFLWIVVLACLVLEIKDWAWIRKRAIKPFLLGAALMAISLVVHYIISYDVPVVSHEILTKYMNAFIKYWDFHRQPALLGSLGSILNCYFIVMGALFLLFCKNGMNKGPVFFLHSIILFALLGLGAGALSHLPPEKLPNIFFELMPTRMLNVVPFCFMGILIAALYRSKESLFIQGCLLFLIVDSLYFQSFGIFRIMLGTASLALIFVIAVYLKRQTEETRDLGVVWMGIALIALPWINHYLGLPGPYGRKVGTVAGVVLIPYGLLGWTGWLVWLEPWAFIDKVRSWISGRGKPLITVVRLGIMGGLIAAAVLFLARQDRADAHFKTYTLNNRSDDAVLVAASRREGMLLLSPGLHLFQLRTRRPVLLDPDYLDMLPYTPQVGPEVDRILSVVYGINFFDPPEEVKKHPNGTLPKNAGKGLWEGRSKEAWQKISSEFGVSQVVTRSDWKLNLPVEAKSEDMNLYNIP